MDKKSPFIAFRYLTSPFEKVPTLFDEINPPKEELIADYITELSNNLKTEKQIGNKRFLVYGFQSNENLKIFKFARESVEKVFLEGETDIIEDKIKETKFVYVIIDITKQLVLIERNVSVFQDVNTTAKYLSTIFREHMRKFGYVVNIYALSSNYKFWNYVEDADFIYELKLELNAPNFPLFGNSNTREVLQEIKDDTNNEKFQMTFINLEGKLKVIKGTIGGFIDYILEVGGKYLLNYSKNGVRDTKTSEQDLTKTFIERKKEDKYNDDEISNIQTKIDNIHQLETRKNEDEQ